MPYLVSKTLVSYFDNGCNVKAGHLSAFVVTYVSDNSSDSRRQSFKELDICIMYTAGQPCFCFHGTISKRPQML